MMLVGLEALSYANQIGTEIQRIQQDQEETIRSWMNCALILMP